MSMAESTAPVRQDEPTPEGFDAVRRRHRTWLSGLGLLGRPWLVMGSAPSPATPDPMPARTAFIHVKYAGRTARILGLPEGDLTMLLEKTQPEQIEGVTLHNVLRMRRKLTIPQQLKKRLPFARFSEYDLTHKERDDFIVGTVGSLFPDLGEEERPSNGVGLICYAIAVGVPRIIISGISLDTIGYGYAPDLKKRRRHIAEDEAALAVMAARHPQVCTTEESLSRITGLPLYQG